MTQTASPAAARMPPGIPFIVANEFAERFCYYGINAILAVYMTQTLHFGDAKATQWQSLFKSAAYFFPLVGAIVSDVFWGKFRTIITFSMAYVAGCSILALVPGELGLMLGLGLMAFGTGGIKPCVSTNVGDQFTSKNQHLIEKAFGYFYFSINLGSSISIYFCPVLLKNYGPLAAFGMPAVMMAFATVVFWLGRKRFAVVPPAGKAWLKEVLSSEGLKTIGSLCIIYVFVALFWSLWEQSNGQTWTLQATSDLMDKHLFGFLAGVPVLGALASYEMLASQIQVVNGLFILMMIPFFTFIVYPLMRKAFAVTPLRKIGIGLFAVAASFVIVAWIESQIQSGHTVSLWWQISAYGVLSASEVLVSITALEFSYTQAPLRMKSFIMALFLISTSVGNLFTAAVNGYMVKPLTATAIETGAQTWVSVPNAAAFTQGQKIDFSGNTGVQIDAAGKRAPLAGTFLVAEIDTTGNRLKLMDSIHRAPVVSSGSFVAADTSVSTYSLVGPAYFLFFAKVMAAGAVLFIIVALFYRERIHVRKHDDDALA